ncbi:response regulator [Maridesulfovibrio ferrireducens]|uniref:response regulator n=1 Tax=Maridesulfovibrio ferrireducens TaxID=246191 RepID=UPI001A28E9F2|nr:response regulator [Maridesulfovibrio ferrireducens]MBI9113384.1 response regulator [Maridesulfovibrio ferrireducens]
METYKEMIILIAEDNDGHAELIKEGLKDSGVCNEIIRFSDGKETWDFLSGIGEKVIDKDKHYLLLLDINMPKMDGVEVLRRMKANKELKEIPIMMLTTTDDPREIEHCYKLGCNVYITKPVDFKAFAETLKRLGLFIQVVKI